MILTTRGPTFKVLRGVGWRDCRKCGVLTQDGAMTEWVLPGKKKGVWWCGSCTRLATAFVRAGGVKETGPGVSP